MVITVNIPEDIADQLLSRWEDLQRLTLEALVASAYREGVLSGPQAQDVLGFESRMELDGFLKAAGIFLDYTADDLAEDIRALREV
jgi:hypothetical protein